LVKASLNVETNDSIHEIPGEISSRNLKPHDDD
jgi:hypothetical protein